LNAQPSVKRALPPVGWQRTVEQLPHNTTVLACEKTTELKMLEITVKQKLHLVASWASNIHKV
jgi:hypothetical protein